MLNHQDDRLDAVFKALSDRTRRAMLVSLGKRPATLTELAGPLGLSLPRAHQQLAVLEAAGLVRSGKAGRVRTCEVEPAGMRAAEAWFASRRLAWERRLERLERLLEEDDDTEKKKR